jgi:dihydroflavonol-4-reductase
MRIFILDGTGFLGYHAAREFLQHGHQLNTIALPSATSADLFPPEVSVWIGDFNILTDREVYDLFKGCGGEVFAVEVGDRVTPKAPAYEFFYQANVVSAWRRKPLFWQLPEMEWM